MLSRIHPKRCGVADADPHLGALKRTQTEGTQMRKTTRLKQLLADRKLLMAPGAYDVLSAKVVEMAGFDAVYMTGYGTSASILGQPDVGLLTMSEMVAHARNIAQAVNIPVLADGDTGYGNPLNIRRTV